MRVVTNVPTMDTASAQSTLSLADRFAKGNSNDTRLLDVKKGDTVSISEEALEKSRASEAFRNQVRHSQGAETTIRVERSGNDEETVIDASGLRFSNSVFGSSSPQNAPAGSGVAGVGTSEEDGVQKAREALQKAQQELEKAQARKAQASTPQEQVAADAQVMAATQKVAMAMAQLTQATSPEM